MNDAVISTGAAGSSYSVTGLDSNKGIDSGVGRKTHEEAAPTGETGNTLTEKYNLDAPKASGLTDAQAESLTISLGSLLKLLMQLGQSMWDANRESRQAELTSQVSSIHSQASKMREAAMISMVTGIVSGVVGMIGAGISFAGSVKGLSKMKSLASDTARLNNMKSELSTLSDKNPFKSDLNLEVDSLDRKLNLDFKKVDHLVGRWSSFGQGLQALSQAGQGAGQAGSGIVQANAKNLEAEQTEHQAKFQEDNEFVQYYNTLIRDLRSLFAQINQDMNQTVRSVVNKA